MKFYIIQHIALSQSKGMKFLPWIAGLSALLNVSRYNDHSKAIDQEIFSLSIEISMIVNVSNLPSAYCVFKVTGP